LEFWRGETKVRHPVFVKRDQYDHKEKAVVLRIDKMTTRVLDSSHVLSIFYRGKWRKPIKMLAKYDDNAILTRLVIWTTED